MADTDTPGDWWLLASGWLYKHGFDAAGSAMVRAAREACVQPSVASYSDEALLRAFQLTDGAPGNPQADALADEIERRGLDV